MTKILVYLCILLIVIIYIFKWILSKLKSIVLLRKEIIMMRKNKNIMMNKFKNHNNNNYKIKAKLHKKGKIIFNIIW